MDQSTPPPPIHLSQVTFSPDQVKELSGVGSLDVESFIIIEIQFSFADRGANSKPYWLSIEPVTLVQPEDADFLATLSFSRATELSPDASKKLEAISQRMGYLEPLDASRTPQRTSASEFVRTIYGSGDDRTRIGRYGIVRTFDRGETPPKSLEFRLVGSFGLRSLSRQTLVATNLKWTPVEATGTDSPRSLNFAWLRAAVTIDEITWPVITSARSARPDQDLSIEFEVDNRSRQPLPIGGFVIEPPVDQCMCFDRRNWKPVVVDIAEDAFCYRAAGDRAVEPACDDKTKRPAPGASVLHRGTAVSVSAHAKFQQTGCCNGSEGTAAVMIPFSGKIEPNTRAKVSLRVHWPKLDAASPNNTNDATSADEAYNSLGMKLRDGLNSGLLRIRADHQDIPWPLALRIEGTRLLRASSLPFRRIVDKLDRQELSGYLLEKAVADSLMNLTANGQTHMQIDASAHSFQDRVSDSRRLNEIYWEPNLSPADKVDQIASELMAPNGVDLLISGQFLRNADGSVTVRPFVIDRAANLTTQTLTLKEDEFFCRDGKDVEKVVLCEAARKEFDLMLTEIIAARSQQPSGDKIHIATLSFLDAESQSPLHVALPQDAPLSTEFDIASIDKVVEEGMKSLAQSQPRVLFSGTAPANNEQKMRKLAEHPVKRGTILAGASSDLIETLMPPDQLDVVVSGQLRLIGDAKFELQPVVFSRTWESVIGRTLEFDRSQLECRDANEPGKRVLCAEAADALQQEIAGMLETR